MPSKPYARSGVWMMGLHQRCAILHWGVNDQLFASIRISCGIITTKNIGLRRNLGLKGGFVGSRQAVFCVENLAVCRCFQGAVNILSRCTQAPLVIPEGPAIPGSLSTGRRVPAPSLVTNSTAAMACRPFLFDIHRHV